MTDDRILGEVSLPRMLQDMVLESLDIHQFLDGLAGLAADRLSSEGTGMLCGITLLRPRSKGTVASSSEQARLMDEIQYQFDDGPCIRAAREGQIYVVPDFREESRFGEYPRAVAGHGLRSALGVPIPLDGFAAAGLNLYSPQPGAFDDAMITTASDLAREASQSLRLAVRVAHLSDTGKQLRDAMSSRTTIDVAAGVIMGQNRCSHDTAMTILKAASSGRNVKLAEIAAAVVASIGQQLPETHFDA
ncbi:GAF and ANTAR domain-containing protein [Arthrobacter bussei]|uniref:GAF and ANTAR domain-containing protein n=1 Tax=Arthrobacter bussei TaxID=2594179 RepID=A0A7X1NPB5_9MICC|nr:GAF and ANTAR domain-containing protein [Arthrobacter bussei]MPY10458.1 GAF and ANTAR domain-containing protein [Arthrobacter bussei]